MRLAELVVGVAGARLGSGGERDVVRVVEDSRQAGPGDLFVAIRGLRADGHEHAAAAAARGAAVALEREVPLPAGTAWVTVRDTRSGLGELAAVLLGRPARRLCVIGITGTTGKSTTTHMTAHLLEAGGLPAGYLSTVAHAARAIEAGAENMSGLTTMGAADVQRRLAEMAGAGAQVAVLEASSHALEQDRLAACDFDVAAYTNVSQDHLDYHGSPERYLAAKARLIELCAGSAPKGVVKTAVLNRDDSSWQALAAVPVDRRLTYGIDCPADVRAENVTPTPGGGSTFRLVAGGGSARVELRMPARFNVANALCAAACGLALGMPLDGVAAGLSGFGGLSGRLERVDAGQPFDVYVDFAHSAVGLASVLGELRRGTGGRLLAVFGATARSDHDPAGMGRAACEQADFFVITTDDPLDVSPAELAHRVEAGVAGRARGRGYEVELDRRLAIRRALAEARPGDVVLLAGKGHERTMRLAGGDVPWDERAEAEAAIRDLYG
jgi:UDP-N-acetylmuramyl-tripeptide synthetase